MRKNTLRPLDARRCRAYRWGMTNPTPTDQDDDLLDFSFLDLPPGAKPRRPRPEMDRIEAGFARAAWLIDQGIHDTDPLSTRNRRK